MTSEKQSKNKKRLKTFECPSEKETKSAGKRKRDQGELENELQKKKLLVRKKSRFPEKNGNIKALKFYPTPDYVMQI